MVRVMAKPQSAERNPKDAESAARISALMKAAGLDQEKLAKRARVGRSTAYAWTNGFRRPSRRMQPRLAKIFGTTIAAINGWAA